MERIGFGLFGSPIGLNYVSNGLFKTLQIEGETYLNLPNGVELSKGERIAKISRQVYSSSHIEIIKIYIYEHAVSFDKRGGGFIGSAYVFVGNPTQTLLYHAVKHLHPKVFSLLDDNRKFKFPDFNLTEKDLINPNTTGLTDDQPRKTSIPTDKKDYLVLTDGSLLNHLLSVVQGFMYNPNFKNIEHIYVSDSKSLLKRIANNNEKSILGLGHLLNFQNHFNSLNKKLQEKDQERIQLEKDIQEKERKATAELENKIGALNLKIDRKQKSINQKNNQITQLDNEIINKQDDFKRLEQDYQNGQKQVNKLKQNISALEEEKEKLNVFKAKTFSNLLNDKKFASEKKNYENHIKLQSNQKINELKQEKEKQKENHSEEKRKIFIFGGALLLLFLLGGYFLGDFYPLMNKPKTQQIQQDEITSTPKGETSERKETVKKENKLPPSYTLKDFLELSPEDQKTHKKKLDDFIQKLDQESSENQKAFFERKWNIGELIDVNKFDENMVLAGFDRITAIKETYKKHNIPTKIFDNQFGISELDVMETHNEIFPFGTSSRNDILKGYLDNPESIYSKINLPNEWKEVENFEEDAQLLYMHFRWVIWRLSNEKVNLKTTGNKDFVVPLIKE